MRDVIDDACKMGFDPRSREGATFMTLGPDDYANVSIRAPVRERPATQE